MKNINARSPSFSSDKFKGFRLDFDKVAFINKKFNKLPSFPYFKLFLQHISHNFQNKEEIDFFKNIENINKISIILKNYQKDETKRGNTAVSIIYGAHFTDLSNFEQNDFDKKELEIVCA